MIALIKKISRINLPTENDLFKETPTPLFSSEINLYDSILGATKGMPCQYPDQDQYIQYINIVKSRMDWCSHCRRYLCCPLCRDVGAYHAKDSCGDRLVSKVRERYQTWRRFFPSLANHEWIIQRPYFHYITNKLSSFRCPCRCFISHDDKYWKGSFIISQLQSYNCDVLTKHAEYCLTHGKPALII